MTAPHRAAQQTLDPTGQVLVMDWSRHWTACSLPADMPLASGLRFALYGRVSTEDYQDPATSRAWQLLAAQALVSGHGRIVAEFFDTAQPNRALGAPSGGRRVAGGDGRPRPGVRCGRHRLQ